MVGDNEEPLDTFYIRDAFYEFILSMMKDYNKFILKK